MTPAVDQWPAAARLVAVAAAGHLTHCSYTTSRATTPASPARRSRKESLKYNEIQPEPTAELSSNSALWRGSVAGADIFRRGSEAGLAEH